MLNYSSLLRFAPWIALAAFVAWFWYRGERIDALQAENTALMQRVQIIEKTAQDLQSAVSDWSQDQARIAEESKKTREVIRRSFRGDKSAAGYFPADVFDRLRSRSISAGAARDPE